MKTDKKAYQQIILDQIDPEGYGVTCNTDKEKLQFLRGTFHCEAGHNTPRMGEQKAFSDWLRGLPSALSLPYTNHDIMELAREHSGATDADEDKILANYWDFMATMAFQLFRKHGIF